MKKHLPLGIQTFRKIIEKNCVYVDKTRHILELITTGDCVFLSRPRRFGKSLLVSTLKEIFAGNRELFRGLYIYDQIDWQPHPVIQIDFSLIPHDTEERLTNGLLHFLKQIAEQYQIRLAATEYDSAFAELIRKIAETRGAKVVVLIDEYDKAIIDVIHNIEAACRHRDILKNFYEILKGSDPYLKFVFLTGVSKFSRVSVFSGLNNLQDITLAPRFATLTGYTQDELECVFAEYLQRFCDEEGLARDELLARIRQWYNGYSWNGKDRVYNPFSILNLFAQNRFSNYWFSSGTPTFLLDLIQTLKIETAEFENKRVPEVIFDSYEIEKINIYTLLFQTGYLTITQIEKTPRTQYVLNYPNLEVKEAFLTYLLERFTSQNIAEIPLLAQELREHLQRADVAGFINIMRGMLAKIPYQLHLPQEAYYHSLFYMIAALMGVELDLEVLTDKGRIDGVLELEQTIYLIEFKYGKPGSDLNALTEKALRQIETHKYAERFCADPRPCILLGVGFADKNMAYQEKKLCRKT